MTKFAISAWRAESFSRFELSIVMASPEHVDNVQRQPLLFKVDRPNEPRHVSDLPSEKPVLIEQLTAVMDRSNPPPAAIGSPLPPRDVSEISGAIAQNARLAELVRTPLSGGDASYAVRSDLLRSTVAKVLGAPRPAFFERGAATASPYLEVVGTQDREIAEAMAYAAPRWGTDEVIIHVGGRHTAKIIGHAVAQGLQVANRDSYVASLVGQDRARQADAADRRFRNGTGIGAVDAVDPKLSPRFSRRSRRTVTLRAVPPAVLKSSGT